MKFIKRLLVLILVVALFANNVSAHAADSVPFEGVWNNQHSMLPNCNQEEKVYEIIDEYTIVRDRPYQSGAIVRHFHTGTYVKGEMITNSKWNKWLRFEDENGEMLYTYSSHLQEHKVHCWSQVIEAPAGRLAVCDCGYMSLQFDNNHAANITVDGIEYLKQIILGNYSETHSFTSAFGSMLIGLTPVGVITDIRDLSADVYYCSQGDCDLSSLIIDFAAFLPLLDILRHADSLRAVKTLDAASLAKYSNDLDALSQLTHESDMLIFDTYSGLRQIYSGKSRALDIEIHHAIEKRFEVLFDVDTNDYFSTPLWRADHDAITAKWRQAIPYDLDYSDVTYSQMIDAVEYVYSDNTVMRQHALQWVAEHWKN